ncbi:hypothetical protein RUM44_013900 [Polyplax serrata]|uniref:Uncharacterized protein n=1 Tax=Polyplax serrata TaxID=468196 RepID=A0ABR1BJJ3_POLSC
MDDKSEINPVLNVLTSRLKIDNIKRKWRSLMSESKINELEKLWKDAHSSFASKLAGLASKKKLNDISKASTVHLTPLQIGEIVDKCKTKSDSRNKLEECADVSQNVNLPEENLQIKTEMEILQKEVANLKDTVDEIKRSTRCPKREFP